MVQMTSIFSGILSHSSATVSNIGASVWVMDPAVNTVVNTIPLPDYLLDAVRSLPGVRYAVPLCSGGALVKLRSGALQAVSVIGLDDSSPFGRRVLERGNIEDIYPENGFIVLSDAEFKKLEDPVLGTEFELNVHRGVVAGIARVAAGGLFGVPTLCTTYSRAIRYLPTTRFTASYVLVELNDAQAVARIKQAVAQLGYLALTKQEFIDRISNFYKYKPRIGTNIPLMTAICFIVGLSISGQNFYTFILESRDKFGALKSMGAKGRELAGMILFQSIFTALTGYGIGAGLCTLLLALAKLRLSDCASLITFGNRGLAFGMVLLIAAISSYIGIRKVLWIEPFDIFRG
ncbi:ABC transporter permease [Duganella rhizosphaerae]